MPSKKLKEKNQAEALNSQGQDLYKQNKFDDAIKKWKTALIIYEKLGMKRRVAGTEMNIGAAFVRLGLPKVALKHFNRASLIFEGLGREQKVAEVETNIGAALLKLGYASKSLEHFNKAKSIFEKLKRGRSVAVIKMSIGVALENLGMAEEALKHYSVAKPIFEKLSMERDLAAVEINLGSALMKLGRFEEALSHFEVAKPVTRKLGMEPKFALIEMNIGVALGRVGKVEEAIKHLTTAKLVFKKLGMESDAAIVQLNIGTALMELGKLRKALRKFEKMRSIFSDLRMEDKLAAVEMNIGIVSTKLGRLEKAMRHLNKANLIFKKLGMEHKIANTELNIAEILIKLGRPKEAIKHLNIAKLTYERLNIEDGAASVEASIGVALENLNRFKEALQHYETAKPIFKKLGKERDAAITEMNIGGILIRLGNLEEAVKILNSTKSVFARLGMDHRVADCETNIGAALDKLGCFEEALQHYRAAKSFYEKFKMMQKIATIETNIGIVLMNFDNIEDALKCFERSIKINEKIRLGIRLSELQGSLKTQYLKIFDVLCLANLKLYNKTGNRRYLRSAFANVELSKCSSVAEALQIHDVGSIVPCPQARELVAKEARLLSLIMKLPEKTNELLEMRLRGSITDSVFHDLERKYETEYDDVQHEIEEIHSKILVECIDSGNTPFLRDYDVLRKAIKVFPKDVKWKIIEFAVIPKYTELESAKLIVFLIDPSGSIIHSIQDVEFEEILGLALRCQSIAKKIRRATLERNEKLITEVDIELSSLSKELYKSLISEELGKVLKKSDIKYLIVVPHKFLHLVPFELLYDGDDYWGLKYAISSNFSLDLARVCVEKRHRKTKEITSGLRFLFVKNPTLDLTGAEIEVDEVCKLLQNKVKCEVLEHKQVTKERLSKSLNESYFDILHYAGHAQFMGKKPSFSMLLLSDKEPFTASEIIRNIQFKGCPIVYLSACETGITRVILGDEMFGLVRALMFAGATSLVLSRWLVSDYAALVFATEFYKQLINGKSVAVALRNARCKVHENEDLDFIDWLSFSLSGDPFRKIMLMHDTQKALRTTL